MNWFGDSLSFPQRNSLPVSMTGKSVELAKAGERLAHIR